MAGESAGERQMEEGEKYIRHILTKPVEGLCTSYEANAFEHVASRWLRLAMPPIVESSCALTLSSLTKPMYDLTDKPKAMAIAQSNARRKLAKSAGPSPAATPNKHGAKLSYTDQADRDFHVDLSEKKILKLCKKGSDVRITKIREVIPDWELMGSEYATGILDEGQTMPRNSFAVASNTFSEACYYEPSTPPAHVEAECADGSIYATPQSILIVQKMTSQAPKKWLCFRQVKQHPDKLLATELQDLRYKITKDTSMDASTNASVILQAKKP